MCKQPALGDKMVVPAVFRDFRAKMPADFEPSASGRMTAVTGMVFATAGHAPPKIQLTVDRPFAFAIVHTATGVPLFMGQVADPSAHTG